MRPIAIAIVEWNNQVPVGQRPLGVVLAGYLHPPAVSSNRVKMPRRPQFGKSAKRQA